MKAVRIVVYGASLVLVVIEVGLRKWPNCSVIRIDPAMSLADDQIQMFQPDIVITDGNYECTAVCPGRILRVDHNANNHAAILDNQVFPIGHMGELIEVIQHYVDRY